MKSTFLTTLGLTLLAFFLQYGAYAQTTGMLYLTSTTYESYQVDKIPFAMRKIGFTATDAAITVANKTFYKILLSDGSILYTTSDKKGYLYVLQKPGQAGFIVCPNGVDWSCYFKYLQNDNVPPPDNGAEEAGLLKAAIAKIVDPRTKYFHIAYSSYPSKNLTGFAENSLAVIYLSADTISVNRTLFGKVGNALYRSKGRTYMYMPDNETIIFRDPDASNWASFYKRDAAKAHALIASQYKFAKELSAANAVISGNASSKIKAIMTSYLSNLKSRKNDPGLVALVLKYWNSHFPGAPGYRVIFLDDDMHVTANSLGIPLRRSISAWVLYRQNGKCYAQWYQYGYAYAGGGIYSKEFTQWKINDNSMYAEARTAQGNENLYSGSNFEFDCDAVK
jgi:hypothetical protein